MQASGHINWRSIIMHILYIHAYIVDIYQITNLDIDLCNNVYNYVAMYI